jgi:TetR/AcrR family transcriptional regulator
MDNRQRLLDVALNLFSQRGYDAVGVQEIVEAAGVTKPTLYHYFDSKRGLLDALLKRESGQLLTKLLPASIYQGDLVHTLEAITRAYFQLAEHQGTFYRLQLAIYYAPPESEANQSVRPFIKEQHAILEDVFIRAAEDHGNLRGRHQRYAAGFLGVINAMIGLYFNSGIELNKDVVYQTVHQFMYGIFS